MAWCVGVGLGVGKMHVQPGLVGLDVGVGRGLDGDNEEVVGVVSCEMEIYFCFALGGVFLEMTIYNRQTDQQTDRRTDGGEGGPLIPWH